MERRVIVNAKCKEIKQAGKSFMEGNWKAACVMVLIYLLVTTIPPGLFNHFYDGSSNIAMNSGMTVALGENEYSTSEPVSPLASIYTLIITGPMLIWLISYFVGLAKEKTGEYSTISMMLKSIGLMLYMAVFIFLWALLFIIPGIIAAMRYSQAFFVLAEDPSKGIRQCVKESKVLMKGNKGKFFILLVSFFGWIMLAAVVATIASGVLSSLLFALPGLVSTILVGVVSSVLTAPVSAYVYSTQTAFYGMLRDYVSTRDYARRNELAEVFE